MLWRVVFRFDIVYIDRNNSFQLNINMLRNLLVLRTCNISKTKISKTDGVLDIFSF